MPMPKGYKSQHGYGTNKSFEGGEDYRTIARKMTVAGSKMNHATARNYFLRAMEKLAKPMVDLVNTGRSAEELAADPQFQDAMIEILSSKKKNV